MCLWMKQTFSTKLISYKEKPWEITGKDWISHPNHMLYQRRAVRFWFYCFLFWRWRGGWFFCLVCLFVLCGWFVLVHCTFPSHPQSLHSNWCAIGTLLPKTSFPLCKLKARGTSKRQTQKLKISSQQTNNQQSEQIAYRVRRAKNFASSASDSGLMFRTWLVPRDLSGKQTKLLATNVSWNGQAFSKEVFIIIPHFYLTSQAVMSQSHRCHWGLCSGKWLPDWFTCLWRTVLIPGPWILPCSLAHLQLFPWFTGL